MGIHLNSQISPEPTWKKWEMPSTVSSLLATDVSMTVLWQTDSTGVKHTEENVKSSLNVLKIGTINAFHHTKNTRSTHNIERTREETSTLKIERERKETESSSVFLKRFQFPSLLLKDWISPNWKKQQIIKTQQTTLKIFWNCYIWTTCEIIHRPETVTVISIKAISDVDTTRNGAVMSSCALWWSPLVG